MKVIDLCCLYECTILLFLLIIAAFDFAYNWLVDGGWSSWDSWSQCSVTCRGGKRIRFRSCTKPPASHGGKTCSGQHLQIEKCNKDVFCPGNNEVAWLKNCLFRCTFCLGMLAPREKTIFFHYIGKVLLDEQLVNVWLYFECSFSLDQSWCSRLTT